MPLASPWQNWLLALPEIWIFVAACVLLLLGTCLRETTRAQVHWGALFSVLVAAIMTLGLSNPKTELAYAALFIRDPLADLLKLGLYLSLALVFLYGRDYAAQRRIWSGELYALALLALLGMMVMVSSANLLMLYLGLELMSLSIYALIALPRDQLPATEAAMKYFVLGALASGILLYGMSLLYGATHSLDMAHIAQASVQLTQSGAGFDWLLVLGLIFVVAGIGFKFGVVPFHMWVPDVYQGAPTNITLLIASAPKLAALGFALRLLGQGLPLLWPHWQLMLLLLALLSIALGNLVALMQPNLKRMLGYSTIAHMGFLLLALAMGRNGYGSALFYALTYVLMSIAGFGLILLLARAGFEADRLDDLKGLAKRSPWFALMLLFVMCSMAGLPVFVGFFAKFTVLQVLVLQGMQEGGMAIDAYLIPAAVLAVLLSLVGAFYYLRIVKLTFVDEPADTAPLAAPLLPRVILSLNCGAILVLGFVPEPLIEWCSLAISQTTLY